MSENRRGLAIEMCNLPLRKEIRRLPQKLRERVCSDLPRTREEWLAHKRGTLLRLTGRDNEPLWRLLVQSHEDLTFHLQDQVMVQREPSWVERAAKAAFVHGVSEPEWGNWIPLWMSPAPGEALIAELRKWAEYLSSRDHFVVFLPSVAHLGYLQRAFPTWRFLIVGNSEREGVQSGCRLRLRPWQRDEARGFVETFDLAAERIGLIERCFDLLFEENRKGIWPELVSCLCQVATQVTPHLLPYDVMMRVLDGPGFLPSELDKLGVSAQLCDKKPSLNLQFSSEQGEDANSLRANPLIMEMDSGVFAFPNKNTAKLLMSRNKRQQGLSEVSIDPRVASSLMRPSTRKLLERLSCWPSLAVILLIAAGHLWLIGCWWAMCSCLVLACCTVAVVHYIAINIWVTVCRQRFDEWRRGEKYRWHIVTGQTQWVRAPAFVRRTGAVDFLPLPDGRSFIVLLANGITQELDPSQPVRWVTYVYWKWVALEGVFSRTFIDLKQPPATRLLGISELGEALIVGPGEESVNLPADLPCPPDRIIRLTWNSSEQRWETLTRDGDVILWRKSGGA